MRSEGAGSERRKRKRSARDCTPRKPSYPKKLPHPPHRLDGVIGAAERGEAEIALAAWAEPDARGSNHLRVLEQIIEELPTAHAARALHPHVRRVHAAAVPHARRVERLRDDPRVGLVHLDVALDLTAPFEG